MLAPKSKDKLEANFVLLKLWLGIRFPSFLSLLFMQLGHDIVVENRLLNASGSATIKRLKIALMKALPEKGSVICSLRQQLYQ